MLPHLLVEPGILNGNGGLIAQGTQELLLVVTELLWGAADDVQHPHHPLVRFQRHAEPGAQSRFLDHLVKGTVGIFCRVVTHHNRHTCRHDPSAQALTSTEAGAGNSVGDGATVGLDDKRLTVLLAQCQQAGIGL